MWPPWCSHYSGNSSLVYGDHVFDPHMGVLYVPLRLLYGRTYLAIPKYRATSLDSPWSFLGHRLERLLPTYSPDNIAGSMDKASCVAHSSLYNASVCELTPLERMIHCNSANAATHLVSRPTTVVGELFAHIAELVGTSCVRPTGSLVIGSVHSGSDLDIVVPGLRCLEKAIDTLKPIATPLNLNSLLSWAEREARARSLPLSIVVRLYRPWQRLVLGGRYVSLSPVDDRLRMTREERVFTISRPLKTHTTRLYVEPFQESLLDYPGLAMARAGGGTVLLAVFDGLFVPALIEGGYFVSTGVRGLVCWGTEDCVEALFIGVREATSFIVPLGS